MVRGDCGSQHRLSAQHAMSNVCVHKCGQGFEVKVSLMPEVVGKGSNTEHDNEVRHHGWSMSWGAPQGRLRSSAYLQTQYAA